MQENWDNLYKNNKHHSIWPWVDLISEVKKINIKLDAALEMGCGMGANIPFFIAEGIEYFGIDGSPTAIQCNTDRFPNIKENLKVCDFTKEIPFDRKFQLIFDRASITHNDMFAIKSCLEIIANKTMEGGYFIGIDWFSDNHIDFQKGDISSQGSRKNITSEQFRGTGVVHFFNKNEIISLFEVNNFTIVKMEEKTIVNSLSNSCDKRCTFNFIAQKNV